jgi:hypothetical protein
VNPWSPTHAITWTPEGGDPETVQVMLITGSVQVPRGPAYTLEEWEAFGDASWQVSAGVWRWRNEATPGGGPGVVLVEKMLGEHHIKALTEDCRWIVAALGRIETSRHALTSIFWSEIPWCWARRMTPEHMDRIVSAILESNPPKARGALT